MPDFPAVIFAARNPGWFDLVIQIVVFLVVFGAPLLKWIFKKNASATEEHSEPDGADEEGERIRRIREEVARRAAENAEEEEMAPPPASSWEPAPPPPPLPAAAGTLRSMQAELDAAREAVFRSQQEAQVLLRGARAKRETPPVSLATEPSGLRDVRALLRRRDSVRAAVITREVLSPPLSLRRD